MDPVNRKEVAETCISIIHKNVRLEAHITIKPSVKLMEGFSIECAPCEVEEDMDPYTAYSRSRRNKYKSKDKSSDDACKFIVTQDLCIKIPLRFEAEAYAKTGEVICDIGQPDCTDEES